MNLLIEELTMGVPDYRELARACIRLFAAVLFGAIIGYQRELVRKPAGLRTHMLVALGSAVFVLFPLRLGMSDDGLSRIIQGISTGIGFIGGGAILKVRHERTIEGLTTAAGIWLTSAVGVGVALGGLGLGLISTLMALLILTVLHRIELRLHPRHHSEVTSPSESSK